MSVSHIEVTQGAGDWGMEEAPQRMTTYASLITAREVFGALYCISRDICPSLGEIILRPRRHGGIGKTCMLYFETATHGALFLEPRVGKATTIDLMVDGV